VIDDIREEVDETRTKIDEHQLDDEVESIVVIDEKVEMLIVIIEITVEIMLDEVEVQVE